MYYKGLLRKEATPMRVKALLELVSLEKYSKDELYKLSYPLRKDNNRSDFNRSFNFLREVKLIEELSGGAVVLTKSDVEIDEHGVNEKGFKEYMREVLFSHEESLFHQMLKELLNIENDEIHYNRDTDLVANINLESIVDQEEALSFRFWAKYLGYANNVMGGTGDFLIINPYKYIEYINSRILAEKNTRRLTIKEYLSQLLDQDEIFSQTVKGYEISKILSLALMTLEIQGKIVLDSENDARENWTLKGFKDSEGLKSHIEIRGEKVEQ